MAHRFHAPARAIVLAVLFVCLASSTAPAASVFYRVPLRDLNFTDGELPQLQPPHGSIRWQKPCPVWPWVAVPGGEAYLDMTDGQGASIPRDANDWVGYRSALVIRAEQGKDVAGTIVVPAADWKSMVPLHFVVPARAANDDARTAFYRAKAAHYETLLNRELPGAAWFRHEARAARQALGEQPRRQPNAARPANPPSIHTDTLEDTYNLFTGGRALSENLQLDRALPAARQAQDPTVPLETIQGLNVKEMDWAPLIRDKHPETDPLAARLPIDQHAVFFPSFAAMTALVDEADARGVPVLQALEPRAEDARTKERYQQQLCLSLTGLGRLVGPRVIGEVAVTGSDPFLRMGSDVAVLFEAKDPSLLKNLLSAQVGLWRQRVPAAKAISGKIAGLEYFGARSDDRSVCAYVAQLGDSNVIVVTNSPVQLERLAAVRDGTHKALSAAPEYTFFRDRYRRGEEQESAFVVLTDATIRRWCSPRWRIADARRTQAAAVMADLQAKYATNLATGKVEPAVLHADFAVPEMGELRLTPAGVVSSTYGSPDFLTPIAELPVDRATPSEVDLYARWREGYQRNWSNYFDPIAVRLSVERGRRVSADLTVMPLIVNTEYRPFVEIARGVRLTADAGDPHDALYALTLALNRDAGPVKQLTDIAKQVAPQLKRDPFGWVGKSLSVYVDDDALWAEAARAKDPEKFLEDNWHRLPIAVYVASDSPLKLAAFMTAVHAFVDQSAPNVTRWETKDYRGMVYVVVSSQGSGSKELDQLKLYYSTTPEALVLTLNESVIQHALDRQIARREAREKGEKDGKGEVKDDARAAANPSAAGATTKPAALLGESAAFQIDGRAIATVSTMAFPGADDRLRRLAWANLPVLNEWKRLYPDQDPVKVHERLWQTRLLDPAGGTYVWNDRYQTMESTTYGHPGAPKDGPKLPPQLTDISRAAMGVTFEDQGLRARATLEYKPARE